MTAALITALAHRDDAPQMVYPAKVSRVQGSGNARTVWVTGVTEEPLACRWADSFRDAIATNTAIGRTVLVVLAASQAFIICAIDEGI